MKNLIVMLAVITLTLTACAQKKTDSSVMDTNKKTLVAYFSATGTTKRAAEKLAKQANADLMEIIPDTPYTAADLDWTDKQSRSTKEMQDDACRPAIKEPTLNLADYDTIYVGFPIWWDLAPRQVNTYLEKYDLTGKTIIPFATSGGSSISNSEKQLRRLYPKANWQKGSLKN